MNRLRLVKVTVVSHFVVEDDGEIVGEVTTDPVVVGQRDWPQYATTTFLEGVAGLEKQLNDQSAESEEGAR